MEHLQSIIAEYGLYFVFLGTLLEGETVVIMAGFLSHQGLLNPLGVAGAAFLGSWINDQGLFYIAPRLGLWARIVDLRGADIRAILQERRNGRKAVFRCRCEPR